MLNIYDIAGNTLLSVPETEGCEHVAELMNSDYVKLSFVLATGNALPQGAYVVYKGETYRLFEPYTPARSNEVEYKYEPKFHSKVMGWSYKPFFFLETEEGEVVRRESDWSLTGTVTDFLNRIVASIADETGETYSFDYDLSLIGSKSIQFQAVDIITGLNLIAEAWETEWWVSSSVIHLSRCAHTAALALTVGTNVGVPTVTRNDEGYYTRFYAFGSTRNIPQDYTSGSSSSHVVQRRLTLPVATCPDGYKDIREGMTPVEINSKVLIFDHIYPKSALTISSVRYETRYRYDADGNRIQIGTEPGGDPIYETYRVYFFQIAGYTFDLESIIEGKTLSVHFETGNLAGWEYELSYIPEDDEYEIIIDESTGYILPNELLAPAVDNQIVLFNISMPAEYTESAEEELEEALDKEIERLTSDVSTYQVNSYPVQFASSGISLGIGRNVNFTNGSSFLATRVLAITEKLDEPYTVSIRLGEKITKKTTKRLQEEIVDVNKSVEAVATRLLNVSRAWRNYRSSSEILDMIFDADGYFDGTKIRPESIETMMLRVGSRSQQLSFNSVIEPNYGGDPNSIHISAGSLANYGIADTVQNWNISASSYTLASTGAYYIYARCSKSDAAGIVILSQEQITVDEDEDYYHFLLGILHSVDAGVRWISLTYGSTSINGRFIRTGRIISQDNLNYFDLDENKFRVGDENSGLDWNDTTPDTLTLRGALVQSPAGATSPLPCFRGAFSMEEVYYKGDTVTDGGSTWMYINNTPSSGNIPNIPNNYGSLYNWFAVNDARGIAPAGWHVPTIADYQTLISFLGGASIAGGPLKATSKWASPNTGATNSSKFSAVPGGFRLLSPNSVFIGLTTNGYYWSADEYDALTSYFLMLRNINTVADVTQFFGKYFGASVRFVRDNAVGYIDGESLIDYDGNEYATARIGTQVWILQNFQGRHYRDGSEIPEVTSASAWAALTTGGMCAYNNDLNNVNAEQYWALMSSAGDRGTDGADGSDGNYMELRYAKNGSTVTPPSITNTDPSPSGWSTTPPSTGSLEYLWMTRALKTADGQTLVLNWTTPVRIKGEVGATGPQGPAGDTGPAGPSGPAGMYQGEYSGTRTYYGSSTRVDIVKYGDQFYIARTDAPGGSFSGILPTNTSYWNSFGANFESIATGLLFAELAYVDNLGVRVLKGSPVPVGDLTGTVTTVTPNIPLSEPWVFDTYYITDDLASSDGVNYKALRNNIDKYPNENPEDWTTVGVTQPQKRKDRITLSGTSGGANVTCAGITRKIDYSSGGLEQAAADYVVLYAADWLAGGVVLTSEDEDLVFESTVAGQNFTGNTTITNKPNFYRGSIVVRGNEIWEDNEDNDLYGVVAINRRGYHGGHTRNRAMLIGDGKGNTILGITPIDAGGMFKGLNLVSGMPLRLAQMGTAQINALTAREGTLAYDMNTHTLKVYTNAGWRTVQTS